VILSLPSLASVSPGHQQGASADTKEPRIAPLEPGGDGRAAGSTNIRLRWSREGRKGLQDLQTPGSAGAGRGWKGCGIYKHSAPLEPGGDGRVAGSTNIWLRWSREGMEAGSPLSGKSSAQSSEDGKVTDGLQLLIDTEKDVFVQDEPIVVNFHLKNSREQAVTTSTRAVLYYSIEVIDGSGRRILSEEEARRKDEESTGAARYKAGGSARYFKIQPGDEQKDSIDLRKAYSLSPGTTYFIRAKRDLDRSDGNGRVTIVSNRIAVTVLQ